MKPPPQKHFHQLHADEILRLLEVNLHTGPAGGEVKRRRVRFGPNRVTPPWLKALRQFNQPLVYILLVASSVTAFDGAGPARLSDYRRHAGIARQTFTAGNAYAGMRGDGGANSETLKQRTGDNHARTVWI